MREERDLDFRGVPGHLGNGAMVGYRDLQSERKKAAEKLLGSLADLLPRQPEANAFTGRAETLRGCLPAVVVANRVVVVTSYDPDENTFTLERFVDQHHVPLGEVAFPFDPIKGEFFVPAAEGGDGFSASTSCAPQERRSALTALAEAAANHGKAEVARLRKKIRRAP